MSMKEMPIWQDGEETINSITHGAASLLSVFGSIFLIKSAMKTKNLSRQIGIIIFSASMFILYTVSSLYHGLGDGNFKRIMRYVDHCSVFILIAGTYTPFTFTVLRGREGTMILTIVWSIALFGILGKIFFFEAIDKYTVFLYVAMGWTVIISMRTLIKRTPKNGLLLLLAGGITYTVGTYFYTYDLTTKYYHAIFHLFIIAGTIFHYFAVLYFC
ncbi:hypothetical protein M9Y10_014169 [Tritrichomonas musculus]|uniref:Hemolysin-3 n=1 Tax=Tritrichomonas musculus TaxID=1915356 RepID=A0ABR2KYR4_9EUKA